MREPRVGGSTDDLCAKRFEFGEFGLEFVQLGGANEGEVERVEEQDHVLLALELRKGEVFDHSSGFDGFDLEIGSGFANENGHEFLL